jgi:hypothetical protein
VIAGPPDDLDHVRAVTTDDAELELRDWLDDAEYAVALSALGIQVEIDL